MERTEWLKQMRAKVEALYDHLSPQYWIKFGLYPNEMHREYILKFLGRLAPSSALLSAACGAGRYDGMLLEAGHRVVGIDQSAGMLALAKEHFPQVRYEKMGLQEMDFREAFDGVICMDAMEHVCPEDWPGILQGFQEALKPDGVLYFTVVLAKAEWLEQAYQRAKERGLPVVFGEIADEVEEAYERTLGLPADEADEADEAAYHYCPPLEQVRAWIGQAGLVIEEEGARSWYAHFVARKPSSKR
jgi:cyclopropane fatty-acyl-phospholipid synthase-like methyltransferase